MNAIIQAIILGIIEGLTEFLPISSTGHLIVAQRAMVYRDAAELFTVVIQLGAIAAVVWHYRADLIGKTKGLFVRDTKAVAFWRLWIIASIPAAVIGFLADDLLGRYATPTTVGVSLIIGGILIWIIESFHRTKKSKEQPQFESLTLRQAVRVGCFQTLALVPGVSRSGATIMGGVLSGLDRVTATAFSFYLSIPIIIGAGGYKLVTEREHIDAISGGSTALIVGTLTAFILALFVINWLLHYIAKNDFKAFAVYRIVFGIVILATIAR